MKYAGFVDSQGLARILRYRERMKEETPPSVTVQVALWFTSRVRWAFGG